jgi:hypothetical protein
MRRSAMGVAMATSSEARTFRNNGPGLVTVARFDGEPLILRPGEQHATDDPSLIAVLLNMPNVEELKTTLEV